MCCQLFAQGYRAFSGRMVALPAELWELVDEQVALQATFAEFVVYTSRWSVERRRRLFSGWVQLFDAGSGPMRFTGTGPEISFVRDHMQGMVLKKQRLRMLSIVKCSRSNMCL